MHNYPDSDHWKSRRSERLIPDLPLNITPIDPELLETWTSETKIKLSEVTPAKKTTSKDRPVSKREWFTKINDYFGRVRLDREKEEMQRKNQ